MSPYADGGETGCKPYAASGNYIQRMSKCCADCRFDPADASGADACALTTLHRDFLMRYQTSLAANGRTALQARDVQRKSKAERGEIRRQAEQVRAARTDRS